MNPNFIYNRIDKWTVVEFRTANLMDPPLLESIQTDLVQLVEIEDRRHVILDFEKVQYVSSQAIGIVIHMHKKLAALPHSRLVLCSVPPKIMELLRILRLDKLLKIVPSQKEAVMITAN
ncbi:MAG TPA: STAS domain-containing protein [Tepidisphaeraceae bacterium]|nr:STAS domain-containing protein [Tepidisphaeraceae bacterium]